MARPTVPLHLPWESWESYVVFRVAQKTTEDEVELLQAQFAEYDGRVNCKVPTPYSFLVASTPLTPLAFLDRFRGRIREIALSFGSSLGFRRGPQHLFGGPCRQHSLSYLGYCRLRRSPRSCHGTTCRGASVRLWPLGRFSPPSSLLNEVLESVLEGFDRRPTTSCVGYLQTTLFAALSDLSV